MIFGKQIASDVALFAQQNVAEKLPVSPNSPKFTPVADVRAVA
jgi:hypothetical protein